MCFDKIKGALKVRYRRAGDTYSIGGMTKKVKKLFSDKKLTSRERSALPVLYDDEGIVWIPGFPPRDGMKYEGDENSRPLCISCTKIDCQ